MEAARASWWTIDSTTFAWPVSTCAAPSPFMISSPTRTDQQVARPESIVHHWTMDQQVVAAQRAYGAFLAAELGERRDRKRAASESYRELLARAHQGDYESQCELGRIIREPKTLSDLELDPVEIAVSLPSMWTEYILTSRRFTADELVALISGQTAAGGDATRATQELVQLGMTSGDVGALEWLSQHIGEPTRTSAFLGLGSVLVRSAQAVNAAPLDNPTAAADGEQLLRRMDHWLGSASNFANSGTAESEVRNEAAALRYRSARKDGSDLLRELAGCFQTQVTDLAGWLRVVDHLLRRADTWISENAGVAILADLAPQLATYSEWSRAHKQRWGTEHMAPAGFAPGQVLPGFEGTCVNCVSALEGQNFCRQCGTQALAGQGP
jgi:hypothetical protein